MKPACPFDHDGPIRALYGVEPQPIESLPKRCSTCGVTLEYASDLAFITLPKPPAEFHDQQGNVVVMTSEPLSFKDGVRGKYAERYAQGVTVVVLPKKPG